MSLALLPFASEALLDRQIILSPDSAPQINNSGTRKPNGANEEISQSQALFSRTEIDRFIDFFIQKSSDGHNILSLIKEYFDSLGENTLSLEQLSKIKREQTKVYKDRYKQSSENPHPQGGNSLSQLLGHKGKGFLNDCFAFNRIKELATGQNDIAKMDTRIKDISLVLTHNALDQFYRRRRDLASEVSLNPAQKLKQEQRYRDLAAIVMFLANIFLESQSAKD